MARLILLNKPFRVLCQFTDAQGRLTLADFIELPGVYAAGRLDYDSEGLVVLTDSGPLQQRVADPRHKLPKTYWVQVEGEPTEEALSRLARGVLLKDGPTLPARVRRLPEPALWPRRPPIRERRHIPTAWLELTLREGRNRQVRRMTAAVGYPTLRLVRVAVGPWSIEGLAPGQWRQAEVPASLWRPSGEGSEAGSAPPRARWSEERRPPPPSEGARRRSRRASPGSGAGPAPGPRRRRRG